MASMRRAEAAPFAVRAMEGVKSAANAFLVFRTQLVAPMPDNAVIQAVRAESAAKLNGDQQVSHTAGLCRRCSLCRLTTAAPTFSVHSCSKPWGRRRAVQTLCAL